MIPAYEPDEQLIRLVKGLQAEDFSVLVVDDGSGEKYADIFEQAGRFSTVVTREQNGGKGAALKTGMRYIRENLPDCTGLVTCDADGQHKIEDVVRVREQLHRGNQFVLTIRQREKSSKIPFRSRIGNNLSRFVYAMLTNKYLSDNQSGLRGFSRNHLDWLIEVEKNNYDYEMNVLYYAAKMGLKITTIPIESIYIDNNQSSHFNPIGDTVKIYKSLFSLAGGTLAAFLAVELMILALSQWGGYTHILITLPGVGAMSFLICILLNKYVFFKNVPRYDYWATLAFTVTSYFVYMLMCMILLLVFPNIPLFWAFNLVYLIGIPLRYSLHKFIFLASLTRG